MAVKMPFKNFKEKSPILYTINYLKHSCNKCEILKPECLKILKIFPKFLQISFHFYMTFNQLCLKFSFNFHYAVDYY